MKSRTGGHSGVGRLTTWLLSWGLLLPIAVGCNRSHYRHQADHEVYGLVDRASRDPRWPLERFTVDPDPRSRMFDPFCPDLPPMPPDDPTSHRLMHCVDCKPGSPCWACYGQTPSVENPDWKMHLPCDDQGNLTLDRDAAVELALLNSRTYQGELEDLYLSALDVTFERFRLDAQFFGGGSTFFTTEGPSFGDSGPIPPLEPDRNNAKSLLTIDNASDNGQNRLRMHKLFASGGELVVGMANSLVWQFAGPDDYSANTLLDFSLVQPLLRGAGRAVVLESLTDSERALLANIRRMERFRRGFFTQVATGRGIGAGAERVVGEVNDDIVRSAGGFLGLLRQQVEIRNQLANVGRLGASLERLEAFHQGGRISSQQVGITRQSLYDAQSTLLSQNAEYQRDLDRYKITLGLPPSLDIKVEDSLLARFDLIDPDLADTQNEVTRFLRSLRDRIELAQITVEEDDLETLDSIAERVSARLAEVENDFESLIEALPQRDKSLRQLSTRAEFDRKEIDPSITDVEMLRQRVVRLSSQLEGIERARQRGESLGAVPERWSQFERMEHAVELAKQFNAVGQQPGMESWQQRWDAEFDVGAAELRAWAKQKGLDLAESELEPWQDFLEDWRDLKHGLAEQLKVTLEQLGQFQQDASPPGADTATASRETLLELADRLSGELLELSLIQARARLDTATLTPLDMVPARALEIARVNRRDWMNARAALVDVWRQIEVTANNLESDLDVVFSGDLNTTDDNPVRFRGTTGRLRVGLEFDAPLTRLAERNAYREALIDYQRARRQFHAVEDRIDQGLRDTIRTIRLNQLNFEVQRASVVVAAARVDETQERLAEPGGSTLAVNTARDLVEALQALLRAQNRFLEIWVNQEALRMNLDLDLGTMELDDRGVWVDPGPIIAEQTFDEEAEALEEAPLPPETPTAM